MTGLEERKILIGLISEATLTGARQAPACEMLGLSARTVQRWRGGEPDAVDGRSLRHHQPSHKLSAEERTELLAVANSAEFGHLPPSQIVPRLADQQRYIASESTFYRVLKAEKQLAHRRSERPVKSCGKPRAVRADAPNQLYSWDITYLPATIRGQYFYLYLFMDVFSHALRMSVRSDACRKKRSPWLTSLPLCRRLIWPRRPTWRASLNCAEQSSPCSDCHSPSTPIAGMCPNTSSARAGTLP
ncbi:helix-turn-helix domain-containing protein [Paraburkholderia sp. RL18-103-BIB-C]|uniref:helix-turn-helix domain-containing protein n=1 Tax=unclassified Paraburkholderia TaxID=2615204 RepID=UPI0038BCF5E4